MSHEVTDLVQIGAGTFGAVFVPQTVNESIALKIVHHPSRAEEMRKEHEDLQLLYPIVVNDSDYFLFKVPKPMKYYPTLADLKAETMIDVINQHNLKDYPNECSLYAMEKVHPVPLALAISIRQQFFPEGLKNDTRPFICRIYLGKKVRQQTRFFNHLNFPLDADRLAQLKLNELYRWDTNYIAYEMGRCLGTIHFKARRDARDVEFVLGGRDILRPALFCIDFNQMLPWKNHSELVQSFYINDPYYPRPGSDHWEPFGLGYLHGAGKDLEEAEQVLKLIIETPRSETAVTGP